MKKEDLAEYIIEALTALGGSGRIERVCEFVWCNYEHELRKSGDLFYTWQYDIRWSATYLRKKNILKGSGEWILVD